MFVLSRQLTLKLFSLARLRIKPFFDFLIYFRTKIEKIFPGI